MIKITQITLLICIVMKLSQTQALVQLRTSLASSDNPLLAKILQSIDAATSDEHLFEVTLKLLKSLCVCMRDTLKAKEDTYNSAKNLIGLSKTVSTEGKVLDLYKKIYNNTCFNLKHDLSKRSNTSSESWSRSNCGKEDRQKENNTLKNEEVLQTVKNVLKSKLDHILYRALVQTRHHHKYNIKKYNLFGKAKSRVKSSLKHTLIVILTLHPEHKDLSKYNVVEEDLHKVLHKNSTIDIDIIDTKYDQEEKESKEPAKPEVYSDCHLQSLYTYLAESEKKNLTKVFRFLRRRDTIKIYIEVFTGRNHSDYINICCTNGSISTLCKKELIEYIDSQENITVQYKKLDKEKSIALKKSFKNTISKLKQLVKRLDYKSFNNSTIDLNIRNVDISNNTTSTNKIKNSVLAMKESNSITDQLGLKPNGLPNFVENLTHPLKLQDVSRAIILLNDFVSKQTTTDTIKSPATNYADHTRVDLMNTLALTEVPFTESNIVTIKEISPKTISNLTLFEDSTTISEKEIGTFQDRIHTMTVDKQDGIDFNKNVPLQFSPGSNRSHIQHVSKNVNNILNKNQNKVTRDGEKATTSKYEEKKNSLFTENISKYMSLLKLKIRNDTILKPFTFFISKHPENVNNVNFPHVQQELKQDNLTQHNDGNSTKPNKQYYLEQSTKSMNNTKAFPKNLVNLQIAGTAYNNGNISSSSTNSFGAKRTKNWRMKKNKKTTAAKSPNILHSYSKTTHLDKLRPESFTFIQTSRPHHKQKLQSQNATNYSHDTILKHNKLKNISASIRYSYTSTTKSLKTFLTPSNVFEIKTNNTFPERPISFTKRPIMQDNKEKQIKFSTKVNTSSIESNQTLLSKSDNSNLNSDSLITPNLSVVANHPMYKHLPTHTWLSVTTNKTHNANVLNATSKDTANTYDRHKKVSKALQEPVRSNPISRGKNTVTSSNRQLEVSNKTTRKINDIFENTIDESYSAADSFLGDSKLANNIHVENITVASIQSTMPFMKSTSIPTKPTSSDKNEYFNYENVTAKMAPILNATTFDTSFDKTSRIKSVSFKTKTIIPNVEWTSQSIMAVSHFDRTMTSKKSSTLISRDNNTILNLSNMIKSRGVDIKTWSSTTTHLNSNLLDNRNKKIKGKPSSQKISLKNHEIEFSANESTILRTTKFYGLQNTNNQVKSSIPVSPDKTIASAKSSTANIDDDEMVTNKQKVKETLITSTIGLTKVTNMSTLKSNTINYRDRDPIENTINFIETFEDQIELNIPNDKNNTTENYKPQNIESTTAVILTRTINNDNYSTGLSNETERDKSMIDNTDKNTDEQAIRNQNVLSINSMSTKAIKYILPSTKHVIYQEPLMFTETTLLVTSPIAHKYNQSSTTPWNRIENNTDDLKNNFQDIVKNKNVTQKHITETSGSTKKYNLLNTKAAISEELYDEMENSVFATTAKDLYNLGKTRNTEFNSISDQDDEEEFLTKPLLNENDENSNIYTTIDPPTQQNNFIKTFENVGKNTVPEIKETILTEPYDFKLTENVVSQTNTTRISKTNTIKNIISKSELTILPTKPTFSQQNIAPILKINSIYNQKNINDTLYTKSYNAISEPLNVTLASAIWSTTKNYGSYAINIQNETGNNKQTFETMTQNPPAKKNYNFLNTENTKLNKIPDALYDEWFATNSSYTVEIINANKNIESSTKIAYLTTTPTISQQNMFTEAYNAISETKNLNLTNATRNITMKYGNVMNTMKYIDYIDKITNTRNKNSQTLEVITKNRSYIKPYRFLVTEPTEFDKTSETIYNEMLNTSMNNKIGSTSTTWITTKNLENEVNNSTDIVLAMKVTKIPIHSAGIPHNTVRALENITKNTPFKKPNDLLSTENINFKNTSDPKINTQNKTKDVMKAMQSIENRSKITTNFIIPSINIELTPYSSNTLKYSSKNIRSAMFTESYKVILDPGNINKSITVWNTTKKYQSHVNSTADIDDKTQIKDTSRQTTKIQNKAIQKIKAFIKYTSPIIKKITYIQPHNSSGALNKIFSNTSDGLNSSNIEGTTKPFGSILKGGKITAHSIVPQRKLIEPIYSTLKHNSNDIENKMIIESYNTLLVTRNINISTTKKYVNGEINTENVDDETIMKNTSRKITKTQNNAPRKFESIIKYTSPITGSTTDEYIFYYTPDPIHNKMFETNSNNKEDIINDVKINKGRNKMKDLTTDHVFLQSNINNIFKYHSVNKNNKMFTEAYNAILESKADHISTTKNYGNGVINIGNIGDKTKINGKSIKTTKAQKIQSTIKYTLPMTKSITDEYIFYDVEDPLHNKIFGTNYRNIKDIEKNKSSSKINDLTTNPIFLQRNTKAPSYSTFKYNLKDIKGKIFTKSSKPKNVTNSSIARNTTRIYENNVIYTGNINNETKMKDTLMKTTGTENNATQKFERVIKYTSPMTRSTTYKSVFHTSTDPIHNKFLGTNSNNTDDKFKSLTTNKIFPELNTKTASYSISKYNSKNIKDKIFTESYNALSKPKNINNSSIAQNTARIYENNLINTGNIYMETKMKDALIKTTEAENNATHKFERVMKFTSPMTRSTTYESIFHTSTDPIHNKFLFTNSNNTDDIIKAITINKSISKIKISTTNKIFPELNTKTASYNIAKYNSKNIKDKMFTESYNALSKPKNINNSSIAQNTARIYENNLINTGNIDMETKMKDALLKTTETENNATHKFERIMKFTSPMTRSTTYESIFHTSTDPIHNKFLGTNSNNTDDIIKAITINKSISKIKISTTNKIFPELNTKTASYNIAKYNSKNIKDKMFTESYNALSKPKNINNSSIAQNTARIYENNLINTGNIDMETKMKDALLKTTETENNATHKFERIMKFTSPMTRSTTYESIFHTSTDPIHNKFLGTNSNNTDAIIKAITINKSRSKIKSSTTNKIFPERNTKATSYTSLKYNSKNIKDKMFAESYNAISEQQNVNKSSKMWNTTKKNEHGIINTGNLDNEAKMNKMSRETTEKQDKYTQKFKSVLKHTLPMTRSTTYIYVFHNIPDPIHNKVFGTHSNDTEEIFKTIKVNKIKSKIRDFTTNPTFKKTNIKATYINLKYRPNNMKGKTFPELYKYLTKHTNVKVSSTMEKTTKNYKYIDNLYNITVALSNITGSQTKTLKSRENIIKQKLAIVNNTTFEELNNFLATKNTKLYNTTKPIINDMFSSNLKNIKVLSNGLENIVSANKITDLTTNSTFLQRNIEETLNSTITYSPKHMKDIILTDSYNAISEAINVKIPGTTQKSKNGVIILSNIDHVTNTSINTTRTQNYNKRTFETSTHTSTMQRNFTILMLKNAGTHSPLYTKKVFYNPYENGDILNNTFDADNHIFKLKDQIPTTKSNVIKNNVEIKKIQNIITKSIPLQKNLLKTSDRTIKYTPRNNKKTLFYTPNDLDETESTVFETALITTNDEDFWSNLNTTKKHEKKDLDIISSEATLQNNIFNMFNTMPCTQRNIKVYNYTTIAEFDNFEETENDTLNTTLQLNVKASLSKLNNTEIYNINAGVLKGVDKTQDTKTNLITLQNKIEQTPRNNQKYTTKTDTVVFIAPYNSKQIKIKNMNLNLPTYESINEGKQSKIADTNPSENITDISKILNNVTNPTDANKNIAIPFQSTTASTRINTTFQIPIINTKYLLKTHKIKNSIDINEIKDQQKKTTAFLDGTIIKVAEPNIQFTIFKKLFNKTDSSVIYPKIEATNVRQYLPSKNLNIVNVMSIINDTPTSTPTSTKNVFPEESSSFYVTESIFGNVFIPTNYKKTLIKPNITKKYLNYTGKSKNISKASNVLNSIFLKNIITTTASTIKHTQSILNETLLRSTESTMFTTKPELRNIKSKVTTTFKNNLTTIGNKPILNKIASKSHGSRKNETLNQTQAPFYNLESLTKAMSMKIEYFTSKPHTFVHPTKKKLNKVKRIKNNKSSNFENIRPSFVTKTISPILPTSVAIDLLIINTTELQKQVIQHEKTNTFITQPKYTTVEKSKMNLEERQFSEENTKKLMLSKKTSENQELHSEVLSKPLDFNKNVTLKLVSPNSSILLKDIISAEVNKIHRIHTKKLLTAATPYSTPNVSATTQSYKGILGSILNKKATNNRTQNHIDKTIVSNNYLYTKPIQRHDVLNKVFSEYVTKSKSHNANGTFSPMNNTFSGISSNTKLKTTKTFIETTKIPIFKYNGLNSIKLPFTNDTIHSKSSNLKTTTPNEFKLSIRVGIETTKDRIQFSLVSIDENPTRMSHKVQPKPATKTSTKAFMLALGTDQVKLHNLSVEHNNDSLNSKVLTLKNLTRRVNERKDIKEAITPSNDLKQINSPVTTASIEKKPVTVIINTQIQGKSISNINDTNKSTIDCGNKTIAINSTILDSKQKIEIMNTSSTVQPTRKQHKKIVIKPASLTDQFTIETLKHMYQEHFQKLKNNNKVADEIKMKTQMYVTNENIANSTLSVTKKQSTVIRNEEDSDSLFRENDTSEDDNSMFVPHHVPKVKMKNLNNVTKEHNVTYSTTHRLPSHDNFINTYQNLTKKRPLTYFQNKENKTALTFVIKDVKLQNNSKINIEGHSKIKHNNDATTYSTDIKKKLHNETIYITPNQNIIIGKTTMSIAEISNISVGKPSAIEINKRKKRNRKRKKLINALKYKNDIADILKKLVKTKKLDIKKLNSTNKKDIIHGLLSKIRKPTIHINKTYMQNKRTTIPIKNNYKRLSDEKLHEKYQTQIDKPTRKSYFSHANDTQTIHNYQIFKPADIVTRKKNGNKMSNRSFAMTSTINLTEVTKKPEQNKPNPHSFTGMKLDEIGGVLNSTKSYKFLNQSLNNNLQVVPATTFNQIEIKHIVTKPVTSTPIISNIKLSNTTYALPLMNSEIKDRTDYTKNNPILDDDNKPNLKLTTITTTNIEAPIKTHYITIKISIPYLTLHATTKKTSNELDKSPTNIDANEFTPKPKTITEMFNYQSKYSIYPLTPALFTTNATQTNLNSTVQPKIFKDTPGISHSLEILPDFTSNDRKSNINYVQKKSSAPNETIKIMSNLALNDLHVRRHVNEQNESTTESAKQVLKYINLKISNESISTQVYSAISNEKDSSTTPKTLVLDSSDIKGLTPYTEHISKHGTNLNKTNYPQKHLFKAVSLNEIPPGNNSKSSETKNLMYTTNEIMPRETLKNKNLYIKITHNYTNNPDAFITPTILTKVLNLKQNNLILDVPTRDHLFSTTVSSTFDLNSTYGLNYTTIHTTTLKQIEEDQPNIKKTTKTKHKITSSTSSENNLMPIVTTNNPTIFDIKPYINTDSKTTTVKFRTGNNSESSRTKNLMYTTNEIIPRETQKNKNLFMKMNHDYTNNPDAFVNPTIVTKVLNLKQNNSMLEVSARAQLLKKTVSNAFDLNSTYGLNYTTIHRTTLKQIEKDQPNIKNIYITPSTFSENKPTPTVTTNNPTTFNINPNINTDPKTNAVKFWTTDYTRLNFALLSNNQSSTMYTTKRTSNKRKENNPTLKISLNTTSNVASTKRINLNQTTALIKNPYTTRQENISPFETMYRDTSNLLQDFKEKIVTKSLFTTNTANTTNQADIKIVYKQATQNPNETQVGATATAEKLNTINTQYVQTEIMPSLLKIKNSTKIDSAERDIKITTKFVKLPFHSPAEQKTPKREKSNLDNPQKTTQIISTNAKKEKNHTSHLIAKSLSTVSINQIISQIYILDPKSSKSILSRYTKGNKRQNKKTSKIYQKSNKISESSTNINPSSRSNNIGKQLKNVEDVTVTVASYKSNMSYNDKLQNNKTQLTDVKTFNLKSYLTKIAAHLLKNNSILQKQSPNQFKLRNSQNKISHKVTNISSLNTTTHSSKPKTSGLPNFVTIKYKDNNLKYTSRDDRFLPTSYKSNTESNLISTRKIKYNPLSTIFAESGSIDGKNVKIYSSRLNRYHFLRPPLTITNHIKYNTYQPPTEQDNETFKPKISPRPNVSCAILKTMRHKFHSTYEFMEFLKASNCSADNLTIHFNIKNNRFLKPPLKQKPNRKTSNVKHPGIKLTKKVFSKLGSKESLLTSFEKTKLYPVKPTQAVLPKLPPNIVKRINIGGLKKKEIMSMNTRDFFSQHRLATPSHLKNQNIKVRQNNPLLVNTRYSILRPKFNPLEVPRHKLDRPKTFFLPPRSEEKTFAEIYEVPFHHKKLNWKQQIGSVRAALQNNPGALFPTQIKAPVSNVLDEPHTHPKTDWDLFRDKTDLSNKKLWGPPDFVPPSRPPTYDLSLPRPLTPTGDEYNLQQLQYRRNFQVTDWWLNDMYLKVRLPLPINSNPGMVFPRRHFAKMEEVADLGALFIDDILDYKEMLDRGELPLERATSREKGQPLCMEQFYRLLGVCRIPEVGKDRLELPVTKSGTEEQEELVVVACRNYFYPIPVKAVDRGRITPGEIQAQLLHAMVDAAGAPPAPRVGLLTSMNRDQWARAREHLVKDEMNRMNLELISRALCILCLDEAGGDRADTDPETNAMLRAMHGAGTRHHSANRWFDKTVQLIISSDGTVGMCYEHSSAEGVAVVRLAERALARAEVADRPAPPPALLPAPQAMKWNIVPEVQRTIEHAARELDRAISDLDFKVYTYRGYGREFMKSCRTSPDVYIQLAIQYAYYKMYGYLVTTYESASLRRFRQGRVDNIRSAHGAALAWAAAMCTAEASPLNDGTDEGQKKVSFNLYGEQKKLELFEEAARKQTSIMEANILGKGIDNHLLGLREMARETLGELPPVFCDTAYKQMFEFKMSTSQVTTTTDGTFMGYGAVCPDGYGCCYNPKKDSIIFCIASFTSSPVTNTEAYRQSLEEALDSMKLMFQARKAEN